ncbi:hypothetical protein B0O99DRAFT_524363 [Bisporella sp. PMI_857]|nr:hypothetical protein B0O99DRAFT_524363 [Bisporella sp. PMI_857]
MSQTLMRTIVSSSNDALGLLFKAVEQPIDSGDQDGTQQEEIANLGFNDADNNQSTQDSVRHETPYSTAPGPPPLHQLSVVSQDVLQLWNRCRFVKQGWLSAREAVTYVDLFFKNCAPYSPIITDYYSSHSNHLTLVTEETLLCCTILSISSRVHILPGLGGIARGHFIHGCLWGHLEHLISRVIFGQEKISTAKTRTLGTIESFLLMTEWHPRSLHFPPKSEGWDCALLAAPDAPESIERQEVEEHSALYRWREEVFEPAKRSDRMSWMLVGAATTLAHELGIFSDQDAFSRVSDENNVSKVRRMRVRMLLYVYVNQLAMRIGCTTLLPETAPPLMRDRSPSPLMTTQVQQWQTIMSCWYEMTKLMETVTDMCFPSADITRQLLLSGRYNSLLNHFQPLIKQIYAKANKLEGISDSMHDLLFIEYHYIRLYINSIAIQAVVERAQAQDIASDGSSTRKGVFFTNVSGNDRAFNAEVIDAACQILRKTVYLSKAGTLCYAPVRIYLRVISASIFLLKAISLGVGNHDLHVSLGVLDECIQALQSNQRLDEMHLSARYGTLLARHVKRFRANFVTSLSRDGQIGNSSTSQGMNNLAVNQQASYLPASQIEGINVNPSLFNHLQNTRLNPSLELRGEDRGFLDDWLVQPFDPGIAPFELGGPQSQTGFEIGSLDFLWNMPS